MRAVFASSSPFANSRFVSETVSLVSVLASFVSVLASFVSETASLVSAASALALDFGRAAMGEGAATASGKQGVGLVDGQGVVGHGEVIGDR